MSSLIESSLLRIDFSDEEGTLGRVQTKFSPREPREIVIIYVRPVPGRASRGLTVMTLYLDPESACLGSTSQIHDVE